MSWFSETRKKMKRSQTMDLCNTVSLNSSEDKGFKYFKLRKVFKKFCLEKKKTHLYKHYY